MKVKSVTIETDKGDEITMSFDEVDDFFNAMRRLKKSAKGPEPEVDNKQTAAELAMQQQLQMEIFRLEAQKAAEAQRQLQYPMYPTTTGGTGSLGSLVGSTKYEVQGALLIGDTTA